MAGPEIEVRVVSPPDPAPPLGIENLYQCTARDRHHKWDYANYRKRMEMLNAYKEEIWRNFDSWLKLLPIEGSTEYSWAQSDALFELYMPQGQQYRMLPMEEERLLDAAKHAGFTVVRLKESVSPKGRVVYVSRIICERTARELPSRWLRPAFRDDSPNFYATEEKLTGGAAGLDRLACTIRRLLEMGACDRIVVRDIDGPAVKAFAEKYPMFYSANKIYISHDDSSVLRVRKDPLSSSDITVQLSYNEFRTT